MQISPSTYYHKIMRLISWNVNGIRAAIKKDFVSQFKIIDADVFCLQETKAQDQQVIEALAEINNYHIYCNSADRKGYSGTAIISRSKPLSVLMDIQMEEHDKEGRVIAAEYKNFFVVTVYVPNSGSELKRLDYRQRWDADFLAYLLELEKSKPVIVCGDLNVAHKDIDLARPKQNYNKAAGYMQQEINGINNLVDAGFIDTFRYLNPKEIKYSWWSFRAGARARNVGWRIDYFLSSICLLNKLVRADILTEVMGSDHCPVLLELNPD